MRILIVEDEKRIASFLKKGLQAEGYITAIAFDGEEGSALALSQDFDLVVLDIMLPKKDGQTVLKEIRGAKPSLPVIMLTAKDDLESKVAGLDEGANDYITKPFAFEELTARIRAHLRVKNQTSAFVLKAGDLILNLKTRAVTRGDKKISLTAKEFTLLEYLLRHPNQVVSRTQILNHVWDYDFDPESNVVDVYVRYLRKKIGDPGSSSASKDKRQLIETVRGAGYRVVVD